LWCNPSSASFFLPLASGYHRSLKWQMLNLTSIEYIELRLTDFMRCYVPKLLYDIIIFLKAVRACCGILSACHQVRSSERQSQREHQAGIQDQAIVNPLPIIFLKNIINSLFTCVLALYFFPRYSNVPSIGLQVVVQKIVNIFDKILVINGLMLTIKKFSEQLCQFYYKFQIWLFRKI
jgi:hypothetical protein